MVEMVKFRMSSHYCLCKYNKKGTVGRKDGGEGPEIIGG